MMHELYTCLVSLQLLPSCCCCHCWLLACLLCDCLGAQFAAQAAVPVHVALVLITLASACPTHTAQHSTGM